VGIAKEKSGGAHATRERTSKVLKGGVCVLVEWGLQGTKRTGPGVEGGGEKEQVPQARGWGKELLVIHSATKTAKAQGNSK